MLEEELPLNTTKGFLFNSRGVYLSKRHWAFLGGQFCKEVHTT